MKTLTIIIILLLAVSSKTICQKNDFNIGDTISSTNYNAFEHVLLEHLGEDYVFDNNNSMISFKHEAEKLNGPIKTTVIITINNKKISEINFCCFNSTIMNDMFEKHLLGWRGTWNFEDSTKVIAPMLFYYKKFDKNTKNIYNEYMKLVEHKYKQVNSNHHIYEPNVITIGGDTIY